MPLFLLRDGSIRRFPAIPEGLKITTDGDRCNRKLHVVLDVRGEQELLAAWAGGRHSMAGTGRRDRATGRPPCGSAATPAGSDRLAA